LLLLPPITISCSHEHAPWAGTVSISATTLYAVIRDIRESLSHSGIEKLVLVNGHGGNYVLKNIVQESNMEAHRSVLFPTSETWKQARAEAGISSNDHEDMHAGELETSIILHAKPDVLRSFGDAADWIANERPYLLTVGMAGYTDTGVIGRPSLGTAAKGGAVLESLTRSFKEALAILDP
jgi:creatinine amidohydrolase